MSREQNSIIQVIRIWFAATRPFSFTASITPVLIGAALAFQSRKPVDWDLFPAFMASALFIHAATNLMNDYEDYRKGVDREYTYGSSGLLVRGVLSPVQIRRFAHALFAVAFLAGFVIVLRRGWGILALGLWGIAGGYFYTVAPVGYKYRALGDIFVFLFMGVLLVVGAFWALTGAFSWSAVWISVPISLLVAAILFANNARDIRHDLDVGVRTLAGRLGFRVSQRVYASLVAGAYAVSLSLMLAGMLPVWVLAVGLSLPKALRCLQTIRAGVDGKPETIAALVFQTAQLHLMFGLLFAAALLAGRGSVGLTPWCRL